MLDIDRQLTEYWLRFYVERGLCTLCNNTGRLTRSDGERDYCICPNGRTMRTRRE